MGRRWRAGIWVGALSAGVAGCATPPPPKPPVTPTQRVVTFYNTTDECAVAAPVTLRTGADAGVVEVPPGGEARVTVPTATDALSATWAGRPDRAVPLPRDGDVAFVGCAHPVFRRPTPGAAPVTLVQREHACDDGPYGVATWRLEDAPVAVTRPGASVTRWLPLSELVLAVGLAGRAPEDLAGVIVPPAADADEPRRVVLGCDDSPRAGGRLLPLTVWATAEGCERPAPVGVVLAGRRLRIEPGAAFTVSLPAGRHLVTPFDPESGATADEPVAVELTDRGAVLTRSACGSAAREVDAPDAVGDLVPSGDVR